MPKVIISGIAGLDGEYELEMRFTHRDYRTIKQLAGVRANEVIDALNAGDMDIIVALAAIALRRAGQQYQDDALWDSETGAITMDFSDSEVGANDPLSAGGESATGGGSGASGEPMSNGTESSPATSIPDSSGTPPQAPISGLPTSTT